VSPIKKMKKDEHRKHRDRTTEKHHTPNKHRQKNKKEKREKREMGGQTCFSNAARKKVKVTGLQSEVRLERGRPLRKKAKKTVKGGDERRKPLLQNRFVKN